VYTLLLLFCLISANLIRLWENSQLGLFSFPLPIVFIIIDGQRSQVSMNTTQVVLGWWSCFIHNFSIYVNNVDLPLSFVGAVMGKVAHFSTIETGIGRTMLVSICSSPLKALISSSSSSSVTSWCLIG
jgi:hypothetical protein